MARLGLAGTARQGKNGCDEAGHDLAGLARREESRQGSVRQARQGVAQQDQA